VGFAGPRVVQAVTGTPPGPGSHTADSAYGAGLLDAAVPGREVAAWLGRALDALSGRPDLPPAPGESCSPAPRGLDPWDQVLAARSPGRPSAGELLDRLLADPVALRASRGDGSVRAAVGRVSGGGSVGVALAAARGGRPTPDGFRLLTRAARLADRLDLPLLTLVDTPGAEPGPASEADGLAGALAGALAAVLACRSPTLGVLVGEGGSGGALAGLVCDLVLATPSSYFAALVPEGAAAALRSTPEEAAAVLGLRPEDSLHAGVLDGLVPETDTPAFADRVAEALATLAAKADALRRAARAARWSGAGGLG